MALFRRCPCCGANLDPGEQCDCMQKENVASRGANTESDKAKYDSAIVAPNGGKIK